MSEDHDTHETTKRALGALRAANPVPAGADPAEESALQGARARVMLAVRGDATQPALAAGRRRRIGWPRIALATSTAVAAGIVGVLIGWNVAPTDVAPAAPQIAQIGGASQTAINDGAAIGAPEAMSAAGGVADKAMTSMGYGGPTLLEPGPNLPDEAGVANGYRYSAAGPDGRTVAAAVAATFGVEGEVREEGGAWLVGSPDGSNPTVNVWNFGGLVSWSYSDPGVGGCVVAEPREESAADAGAGSDAAAIAEPLPCEPAAEGPLPSPEKARAQAERLLAAVGHDTDAAVWETAGDETSAYATAWTTVDGMRTSLAASIWFGADGRVGSANGTLVELIAIPDYPTVGARTAVLRAQQPGWSMLATPWAGGGSVMPMVAEGDQAETPATAAPEFDGRPVAVAPLTRVTVDDARRGLFEVYQPDGTILLLPAHLVADADGGTWSVLAVADEYVSFAAQ